LQFAEELACACAGALGKTVAGVILHGSLTLGDYVPGRSDVDLLMVIDDPPSDARLAALTEALASRRAEAPGPVDLRLVTRLVAASPTPAPPLEAYLRLTPSSGVRVEERRHPEAAARAPLHGGHAADPAAAKAASSSWSNRSLGSPANSWCSAGSGRART
jgi:predicted nucleotidyltransferase